MRLTLKPQERLFLRPTFGQGIPELDQHFQIIAVCEVS